MIKIRQTAMPMGRNKWPGGGARDTVRFAVINDGRPAATTALAARIAEK